MLQRRWLCIHEKEQTHVEACLRLLKSSIVTFLHVSSSLLELNGEQQLCATQSQKGSGNHIGEKYEREWWSHA